MDDADRHAEPAMPRASIRLVSHGVRLVVTSDSADLIDAATPYLPPIRTPFADGTGDRTLHLSSEQRFDGTRVFGLGGASGPIVSSRHLRRVLHALEWEMSLFVAQHARDRIFVHAGAVEWRGKAIVVPGRSHTGKSTLVAELVRAGCGYLSDEYAILDSSGVCHAHPRRLSIRRRGGIDTHTAEDLGGRTVRDSIPVGCVVVTEFREGASWRPSPLSVGAAAMALLQHTVAARARSREALAVLGASTAHAVAIAGLRGDAPDCVSELLSSLASVPAG